MDYSNKKIIVIDDLETLRKSIIKQFEDEGFCTIYEACDGEDALKTLIKLQESDIELDMIFSDINMPKMDGLELLKIIKSDKRFSKVPVVMLSTENEKEVIVGAVMAGAANYILKPFTKDMLQKKLAELKKFLM